MLQRLGVLGAVLLLAALAATAPRAAASDCSGRSECASWNTDVPVSFLNEYGTCEYGQAAAFGRKCDKPCHGVKYHECECVSQERARNAMMALKNGLAIGGGIVTGIAAIGLISCLAAQRKSNVFMGAAFGPGTHQQRALVRQYSTNYAGGATATTSAVQMGSMPPPMPVPVAAPMTAVDAQGVPIAAPVAVPVPGQPVGYATPIMPMATATTVSTTTTVAAPYVPTYATVPMQHRPRNTCRRVAFMIACPGFFLIVGLTLLIIGSAISPDAYWRGCG